MQIQGLGGLTSGVDLQIWQHCSMNDNGISSEHNGIMGRIGRTTGSSKNHELYLLDGSWLLHWLLRLLQWKQQQHLSSNQTHKLWDPKKNQSMCLFHGVVEVSPTERTKQNPCWITTPQTITQWFLPMFVCFRRLMLKLKLKICNLLLAGYSILKPIFLSTQLYDHSVKNKRKKRTVFSTFASPPTWKQPAFRLQQFRLFPRKHFLQGKLDTRKSYRDSMTPMSDKDFRLLPAWIQ